MASSHEKMILRCGVSADKDSGERPRLGYGQGAERGPRCNAAWLLAASNEATRRFPGLTAAKRSATTTGPRLS